MSTTKSEFVSLKDFTPDQPADCQDSFDMKACKMLSVIGVGLQSWSFAAYAAMKILKPWILKAVYRQLSSFMSFQSIMYIPSPSELA